MARRFLVAGNHKMNGTAASVRELVEQMNEAHFSLETVEVVIAPPALYLLLARQHLKKEIEVAAQNAFHEKSGAYTGEISPDQLLDGNVTWVILGHSERRSIFQESDEFVGQKVSYALESGLKVMACVGESLEEREKDQVKLVVERQLDGIHKSVKKSQDWESENLVIAYEFYDVAKYKESLTAVHRVWAIGTGKTATSEQAQEAHAIIRHWLKTKVSQKAADCTRILYGGSVSDKNAAELGKQPDIDGLLVGGASLKPDVFVKIINARAKI